MKKLLFILALCLSVFASAQCPVGNLTQNAKWRFVFTQCMEDTLVIKYADTSKIAFIDGNGNLTTITYAALLDSLNVPATTPSGNNHNIQFNASGAFGSSTDFNYDAFNGIFYIYDSNGDTLFSIKTSTREIRNFGRVFLPNKADSSVTFTGAGGELETDSLRFVYTTGRYVFGSSSGVMNTKNFSNTTGYHFISSGSAGTITKQYYATPVTSKNAFRFVRFRGSNTAPTTTANTDEVGQLEFYAGYDTSGLFDYRYTFGNAVIGTPSATFYNSAFVFTKGYGAASNSTKLGALPSAFNVYGNGMITVNPTSIADSSYGLTVNGTAAITQTPASASDNDSIFVKSSNNQVMTWLPRKRIALKNDSNSFGELNIKGSNALSTSFGIYTQSSAGTRLFTVANNGVHNYGTQTIEVFPSLNGSSVNTSGRGLVFSTAVTSQDAPAFTFIGNNLNTAAGSQYGFGVAMAFSPSSGTRVFNQFSLTGVVNQTGGANGIVRGIYVAPTLTSAADYRAIETTDGKVILGGTGVNSYLRVHVLTTAQRDALTGLTGGEIIFNSSTSKHQGYDGATWNDLY